MFIVCLVLNKVYIACCNTQKNQGGHNTWSCIYFFYCCVGGAIYSLTRGIVFLSFLSSVFAFHVTSSCFSLSSFLFVVSLLSYCCLIFFFDAVTSSFPMFLLFLPTNGLFVLYFKAILTSYFFSFFLLEGLCFHFLHQMFLSSLFLSFCIFLSLLCRRVLLCFLSSPFSSIFYFVFLFLYFSFFSLFFLFSTWYVPDPGSNKPRHVERD